MALQERRHDQADQVLIAEPFEAGDETEIGMFGVEARQRIDLDEVEAVGVGVEEELDGELLIVQSAPHFLRNERLVILQRRFRNPAVQTAKPSQGKKSLH